VLGRTSLHVLTSAYEANDIQKLLNNKSMSAERYKYYDRIIDEVQFTEMNFRTDNRKVREVCSAWLLELGQYFFHI